MLYRFSPDIPAAAPADGFDLVGVPANVIDWRTYARHTSEAAPQGYFPARTLPIDRIVIHHLGNLDPDQSFTQVNTLTNLPHIPYHLGIDRDGTIYWFNQLWERVPHSGELDDRSMAIVLHGNFDQHFPEHAQLASLQWLVTQLLEYLSLTPEAVIARSELDADAPNAGSPGRYFAPVVALYRKGTAFDNVTLQAVVELMKQPHDDGKQEPTARFLVFDANSSRVQENNGLDGMILRVEAEQGYVIEAANNRVCIDLRGYAAPADTNQAPWIVYTASGAQTGRYRLFMNAVKDAESRKGYAVSAVDNKRRIEFRDGQSL